MAGLTEGAHNLMLDALGAVVTHVSLHTADPGTAGTDEVTGGTYARVAVTWNAASGRIIDSSNQPLINVPGGNTITHLGHWSAPTGGTFYGSRALPAPEPYGGDGTYTVTDVSESLANV